MAVRRRPLGLPVTPVPTSTDVAPRAALADEYVAFLERDVVASITAGFAIIGSLLVLFWYDPVLGLAAAAVAIPVALLNRRLVRRSRRIYRRLNDELKVEVTIIDQGSAPDVHRHFRILRGHWIGLSIPSAGARPHVKSIDRTRRSLHDPSNWDPVQREDPGRQPLSGRLR